MRLWLKTFLGIMAVVLGASTLWLAAAPLTGPVGRNVVFTETDTIDAPRVKGNLLHLHNQTVDPTPLAGDVIVYTKASGLFLRDSAGNVTGPLGTGSGGGGTGVGLTARLITTANMDLVGEEVLEGITTSNSRVFVIGQSTLTQNGIYITAPGASPWTRATDALAGSTFATGTLVTISDGIAGPTGNKGTTWMYTSGGSYNTSALTAIKTGLGPTGESIANKNVASGYAGLTGATKQIWTQRGDAATHPPTTAPTAITPTASTMRVSGSGGPVTMSSATPRIGGCTTSADDGKELTLEGSDATNTLTMPNGQGVQLCGNVGALIFGLNLGSAHFVCNGATATWRQSNCQDLQQAFNVGNKIRTGSTPATGLHVGNSPTDYCTTFWDATNGNSPTTQCFCGGALCPNTTFGPLPVGGSLRVLNNASAEIFKVNENGTVTGLTVKPQQLMGAIFTPYQPCGTDFYVTPVGVHHDVVQARAQIIVTQSFTVKKLLYKAESNIPSGETYTFTVQKNLANTALTCSIIQGASASATEIDDSSCANFSNSFSVVSGDRLSILTACTGGISSNRGAAISLELE